MSELASDRLRQAAMRLSNAWEAASSEWTDEAARRFENRHWSELTRLASEVLQNVAALDEELNDTASGLSNRS